jgi:hypothetical protein
MFLNKIKNFIIKKIVSKSLSNVRSVASDGIIKTVGIIYDESNLSGREDLILKLVKFGIEDSAIKVLVFRDNIKKKEVFNYSVFSNKEVSWSATFDKPEMLSFVTTGFDLLINYYDIEKTPLVLVSHQSKAKFKVGFAAIDKRVNHFMIDANAQNCQVFVDELFKYLKILNKI